MLSNECFSPGREAVNGRMEEEHKLCFTEKKSWTLLEVATMDRAGLKTLMYKCMIGSV